MGGQLGVTCPLPSLQGTSDARDSQCLMRRASIIWKEMSLDFKLMFVYHGCMMVLFIAGQSLSVRQEILITSSLVTVLAVITIRHRRVTSWRWPGVRPRDALFAIGGAAAVAFFLFS